MEGREREYKGPMGEIVWLCVTLALHNFVKLGLFSWMAAMAGGFDQLWCCLLVRAHMHCIIQSHVRSWAPVALAGHMGGFRGVIDWFYFIGMCEFTHLCQLSWPYSTIILVLVNFKLPQCIWVHNNVFM